jgi:uncharacterized protein YjbI with pentapeptide repeats
MTPWQWAAIGGAVLVVAGAALLVRRQTWRDSMALSILGWLFIAAVVGAGTGGLLLWLLGWPRLPRSTAFTTTETLDLLKIALAVVAGFGGVVVLSVNHRRQRFTEKDHRLAVEQQEREQTKLLNERFANAAEQLAHERPQVRLAGVYALASLADDWEEGRQKCVDVLIAYLRLAQSEAKTPGPGEDEVLDTIFRIFRERLKRRSGTWSEVDLDFTGMTLADADFSGLHFAGTVTLDDVVFSGSRTSFARTWFTGALSCRGTKFTANVTSFQQAWFDDRALFLGARFATVLGLPDVWIDGGSVEFADCEFQGGIFARDIQVKPGLLKFDDCVFHSAPVDFTNAQFGPLFDPHRSLGGLLGRVPDPKRGTLVLTSCEMVDSPLTLDAIYVAHGRILMIGLSVRGGHLRIKPTEMRHPSLEVRRIDAEDAVVEIPLPEEVWKGRATGAGDTPPAVRR